MALHTTKKGKSGKILIARQYWISLGSIVLAVLLMLSVLAVVFLDNNEGLHTRIYHWLLPILGLVAAATLLFGAHMFSKSERSAQSLQQSEQRLMQFIEMIPGGVVVVDREGKLSYANPTARDLLGEKLLAVPLFLQGSYQVYPSELLPVNRALHGEGSMVDDVEVHRANKAVQLEIRAAPILDPENAVEYVVAIIFDITKRKQIEGELQLQRDLFEKMVAVARATTATPALEPTLKNALEVLMDITDAQHSNLFLVEPDGMVMYSLLEHGNPLRVERKSAENPIMEKGLAGWVYHHLEPTLISDVSQDERWLALPIAEYDVHSILMVPILLDAAPLGVMGVSHHMPDWFNAKHIQFLQAAADQMALAIRNTRIYEEERRLAEELTRAREISDAASRSKSMFLAKMSHELRTPLTVIMGYSDMLLEHTKQANLAIRPLLERIQHSTSHLLHLINGILDFSEIEAGRLELIPESFSVAELVQVAIEEADPIAEKSGNTLQVECEAGQVIMKTDFQRLHQILENLLNNACKFTSQGTITLKASHEKDTSGDWMRFIVSDTGIGIGSEQVHKLFLAFSQLDENLIQPTDGTGLGLAVSRQIARMMGGDITVVSQLGKGSTFTVRIPCELPLG